MRPLIRILSRVPTSCWAVLLTLPALVPLLRANFFESHDGLFHISERAQGYYDSLTAILQVYLNMSSNQTGEVVKLLTLITVITTPLMIVRTWYGMNLPMPELQVQHSYLLAIVLTVASTLLIFWYFKKKKWF